MQIRNQIAIRLLNVFLPIPNITEELHRYADGAKFAKRKNAEQLPLVLRRKK